uniref:Uncharacterized protein n=1 Tax=Glossina austeni TaxID=7395 RepID=A0A1A9VFQ0_GLOAU
MDFSKTSNFHKYRSYYGGAQITDYHKFLNFTKHPENISKTTQRILRDVSEMKEIQLDKERDFPPTELLTVCYLVLLLLLFSSLYEKVFILRVFRLFDIFVEAARFFFFPLGIRSFKATYVMGSTCEFVVYCGNNHGRILQN